MVARDHASLPQVANEFSRLIIKPWEYLIQSLVSQMPVDRFAEHAPEICCHRQISSFIEL